MTATSTSLSWPLCPHCGRELRFEMLSGTALRVRADCWCGWSGVVTVTGKEPVKYYPEWNVEVK